MRMIDVPLKITISPSTRDQLKPRRIFNGSFFQHFFHPCSPICPPRLARRVSIYALSRLVLQIFQDLQFQKQLKEQNSLEAVQWVFDPAKSNEQSSKSSQFEMLARHFERLENVTRSACLFRVHRGINRARVAFSPGEKFSDVAPSKGPYVQENETIVVARHPKWNPSN